MKRRSTVHVVALTASLGGLASLLALSFGTLAPFRIASGQGVRLLEAGGGPLATLVLAPWVASTALAFVPTRSRRISVARSLLAAVEIVALVWGSGLAAQHVLVDAGPLARYSIGGGAWLSAFFAFALLLACRREIGDERIAAAVTAVVPAGIVAAIASGRLDRLGLAAEYRNVSGDFWLWTLQHLVYAAVAMLIAIVFGVSLGVLAHARPKIAEGVFLTTSVFQTVPGLAMIGILAVPLAALVAAAPRLRALGIGVLGWAPVVIALTLYALLAIVRNTYAGLEAVPAATVESGRGMGMSRAQVLRKVQLPIAAPVVMSGIRTAAQQTIGNATLGVFVAAGTLGRPIFGGVSQTANDLVLLGSIALVALALAVDLAMRIAQRAVTPRPLRGAE